MKIPPCGPKGFTNSLAFEDGPFTTSTGQKLPKAILIGACTTPLHLVALRCACIDVDGWDVTQQMIKLTSRLDLRPDIIFIHGLPYAGFNILDATHLSDELSCPVIGVIRSRPNISAVAAALRRHFTDWRERLEILEKVPPPVQFEVSPNEFTYLQSIRISRCDAERVVRGLTVFGHAPEPLRMARLLAQAFQYEPR